MINPTLVTGLRYQPVTYIALIISEIYWLVTG